MDLVISTVPAIICIFLPFLVRNCSNRIIQNHIEKLRLKKDLIQYFKHNVKKNKSVTFS